MNMKIKILAGRLLHELVENGYGRKCTVNPFASGMKS